MRVKMILPALAEANSPFWRPIKSSLFPPLGLVTLAGYLDEADEVTIQDEHVETLDLSDEPDLVVIQVYITSAYRAYELADHYRRKGARVALGGLHVTSLPEEAAQHADSIFLGPGEDTWPAFLSDLRAGRPGRVYRSQQRTLAGQPRPRRDLLKTHLDAANLRHQHKLHNLNRDYDAAVRRLHDLGVMINASFVFGMDGDDEGVFD